MLQKSFIAPAVFLIVLAAAYLAITGYFIFVQWGSLFWQSMNILWYTMTFLWPILMLIEALLYWRIRKRNLLRKASWAHCCLFAFAYGSFFIKGWIIEAGLRFLTRSEIDGFIEMVSRVQLLIYWVSIAGAHLFFIRVLVRAHHQKRIRPTVDSNNLLDDVLT